MGKNPLGGCSAGVHTSYTDLYIGVLSMGPQSQALLMWWCNVIRGWNVTSDWYSLKSICGCVFGKKNPPTSDLLLLKIISKSPWCFSLSGKVMECLIVYIISCGCDLAVPGSAEVLGKRWIYILHIDVEEKMLRNTSYLLWQRLWRKPGGSGDERQSHIFNDI